jgi:hypothetical protein
MVSPARASALSRAASGYSRIPTRVRTNEPHQGAGECHPALLDGDFPDRAFMRGIIEHNLSQALSLLP